MALLIANGSLPPLDQGVMLPLVLRDALGCEHDLRRLAEDIDLRLACTRNRGFNLEHGAAFVSGSVGPVEQIGRQRLADALPQDAADHVELRHLPDLLLEALSCVVMSALPPDAFYTHMGLPDAGKPRDHLLGDVALGCDV
jgi:hypothetical protein